MKILKYLLVISAMLLVHSAFAQIPPGAEAQAKARLEKVGGTEDEVRKRLIKRGIDPDKIDDRNPQELAELQIALEQIEKELAAEQKANAEAVKEEVVEEAEKEVEEKVEEKVKEVASQTTNEIVESVEEGATIEEAIAEEILEATEDEEAPAKIYGQNVFKDKEIVVYRDADDILAPDSYVLNTGDKIAVSLWGISELDAVYEINKEGFIKPDGIPRINLKGLRLGKAKALLFTRFSNYYRFGRDQFAITVTYPRTITVNIVGEVENQGSFTLPAINTAFNALAAADGPSSIGSVRNIKIISKDGKDKDMDIYKFLLNPVTAEDYYLNDGDYIYVGVAEKNIKISGAIRRPFIYELKENENLKDLIAYAGGLTPNAYRGNFQVKRIINDEVKIIDVDYRALLNSDGDFELVGGDEIIIGNIPTPYKNFVEIAGSVEYPGKYELENGMTISDLLQKGIMADGSRTDVAYLLRTDVDGKTEYQRISIEQLDQSADNLPLQPKDRLIVLSNKSYLDSYEISIRGAVRNPDKFRYGQEDELKLEDLVILSGGLKEDAAEIAYVHRKEFVGTDEQEYIQINIRNAVENPDSEDNIVLQPNDMVEVFSIFDYKEAYKVTISGAVRSPKSYPFAPGNEELRIEDLVLMSGGLKEDATSFAYVYRKDLQESKENTYIRINIKNAVENPDSGDNIILNANDVVQVFSIFDYKEEYSVSIAGAVRNPSTRPFDPSRNLKIEDLVILSGGLKVDAADFAYLFRSNPTNTKEREYIRINIKDAVENPTSPDNLTLEPNDQLQVFSILPFIDEFSVRVLGEVRSPGEYKYHPSLGLKDALTLSGGLKMSAATNRIDVFRMVIDQNQPTKTIVASVQVDKNMDMVSKSDFQLEPFDQIVVRSIPDFELPKIVTIKGEVKYPGAYALLDDNEKISNVIQRAGGLTREAFAEGAELFRSEEGTGYVVLRLKDALRNKRNRHNFILKAGDVITIPKNKDLVSITGATKAIELYPDKVARASKINVAFNRGKRAKWYVDEYAAGIGKNGKKKLITVEHANGEIKRTKNFLFFKVSPKVKRGSVVRVGVKPPESPDSEGKKGRKEKIDWGQVLADSVAQATAILSLILLIDRVN